MTLFKHSAAPTATPARPAGSSMTAVASPHAAPVTALTDAAMERNLAAIGSYVESRSAILCPPAKRYLFEARLRPVLREHSIADMGELATKLRMQPNGQLGADVVEAMSLTASIHTRLRFMPEPATLKMSNIRHPAGRRGRCRSGRRRRAAP
jgi:hypothetical protein